MTTDDDALDKPLERGAPAIYCNPYSLLAAPSDKYPEVSFQKRSGRK